MTLLTLLLACASTPSPASTLSPAAPPPTPDASYVDDVEAWHAARVERLRAADGWLTLIGLHWLSDGEASVGSGADQDVQIASARVPPSLGVVERAGPQVWFTPTQSVDVDGAAVSQRVALATDADGKPSLVSYDSVSFYAIARGDRVGLRVKDSEAATRAGFTGIERYPVDSSWRVTATLEPHPAPTELVVPNVLGDENMLPTPGRLHFLLDGHRFSLDPVGEPGDSSLFIVFGDATNGVETYGGGRFLDAKIEEDGRTVVLDFNKSVNPPCAFTNFATCPLPSADNRLEVAVQAGERAFGTH